MGQGSHGRSWLHRAAWAAAAVAAAAAAAPAPAAAQDAPWSVSFDAGMQVPVSGEVHAGGSGTVLGLATQVQARSYGDVYGSGFYWAAGVGYALSERGELRVQASYTSNPAERLQVGTVAGLALFALFDDYEAFGMDVGYRHYMSGGPLRPFAGASIGFTRLSTVAAEFSVPAAGVVLPDVGFLESSVVPAIGAGGGLQVMISDRVAFQGGLELRWHGGAGEVDGLAGTGLENINDDTGRWALPLTAGLTVRF